MFPSIPLPKLVLSGVVLWLASAGRAETAPASLSLADAVQTALENNPGLRAGVDRAEATTGRAARLGRWSNPELELAAEEWPWRRGRGFADAKQTVGVAQTLPFPGKKSRDRQIGRAEVKSSRAGLAVFRVALIRDVKIAYVRALVAGRVVEVTRQLAEVAEAAASVSRRRVDAGAAPHQEQLRAEVQLEQASAALADRQADWADARRELAAWLGRSDPENATLADSLVERADPAMLDLAADPATHPRLVAAQVELERAEAADRRARLDPWPDPTVGVNAGRIGTTGESIVGVRLSLPLPLLDHGQDRRRETRAEASAAAADLRAAQQTLQRERAAAAQRYRLADQQVAAYRERLLPKAEEALRLVRTGFEQGKFGFIDLLDVQRTTADARLGYLQKLQELNTAQAELEALHAPTGVGAEIQSVSSR